MIQVAGAAQASVGTSAPLRSAWGTHGEGLGGWDQSEGWLGPLRETLGVGEDKHRQRTWEAGPFRPAGTPDVC